MNRTVGDSPSHFPLLFSNCVGELKVSRPYSYHQSRLYPGFFDEDNYGASPYNKHHDIHMTNRRQNVEIIDS